MSKREKADIFHRCANPNRSAESGRKRKRMPSIRRSDTRYASRGGEDSVIEALSSNLCRCTGYQGIIDAVRAALPDMRQLAR